MNIYMNIVYEHLFPELYHYEYELFLDKNAFFTFTFQMHNFSKIWKMHDFEFEFFNQQIIVNLP